MEMVRIKDLHKYGIKDNSWKILALKCKQFGQNAFFFFFFSTLIFFRINSEWILKWSKSKQLSCLRIFAYKANEISTLKEVLINSSVEGINQSRFSRLSKAHWPGSVNYVQTPYFYLKCFARLNQLLTGGKHLCRKNTNKLQFGFICLKIKKKGLEIHPVYLKLKIS